MRHLLCRFRRRDESPKDWQPWDYAPPPRSRVRKLCPEQASATGYTRAFVGGGKCSKKQNKKYIYTCIDGVCRYHGVYIDIDIDSYMAVQIDEADDRESSGEKKTSKIKRVFTVNIGTILVVRGNRHANNKKTNVPWAQVIWYPTPLQKVQKHTQFTPCLQNMKRDAVC